MGFDDDGGGEIGHQVRVGFIELEDGGKGLDGAAEGGGGDGAGEFEVGGEGEIGIGVEIDGGLGAGDEGRAIGLADGAADQHLGGVEDADEGLAAVELIAFLGMAHGVVAVEILVGDHAGESGVEFEFGHVGLSAFEHDFLAIALEFQDAKGGGIALIVGGIGFREAIDVVAGDVWSRTSVFEAVDFAEDGALLSSILGFGEIGFGLAEVGRALFGVGAILGALLFDLVAEVVEFGLGVAGVVDLLGAVEDGDEVAFLDFGAVGDEFGEGHGAALAPDLGDEDFGGMDGFDDAGDADFAFGARGARGGGGMGNGGGGAGAGEPARKE